MHQALHLPTTDSAAEAWSRLLTSALRLGVSDIHLEKTSTSWKLAWRENGVWRSLNHSALGDTTRSAVWLQRRAGLDAEAWQEPQDGVWQWHSFDGDSLYIRVSSLPLKSGFSLVLRLLRPDMLQDSVLKVPIPETIAAQWQNCFYGMPGLHLFAGPTGAGKTTSLFSLLSRLDLSTLKVITAEDPVEYCLAGAVQLQIQPSKGLGFAQALRAFLRHDPDLIIVGEIRDEETAKSVVAAAVTGLQIISTLHCEGGTSAITRLQELGVNRQLADAALRSVLTQHRTGRSFHFDWWQADRLNGFRTATG